MVKLIAHWSLTAVVALGSAMSGFFMVTGGMAEGMAEMGYPDYFPAVLGTWKLLGAVALLTPPLTAWIQRIKEWAYAGFFFTFTGAAATHVAVGDPATAVIAPAVFTALLLASYALRPATGALARPVSAAAA